MSLVINTNAKPPKERGNWGSPVEFILSCVGYSIGLGNVWRFPYLCYENGGGAFLIPYLIAVIAAGRPIYFLELCVGQYSQSGPQRAFSRMAPIFSGIGWGMVMISVLVGIYYNMIIAWVLYYFFASFRAELPWKGCQHDWNTEMCRSQLDDNSCRDALNDTGAYFFDKMCRNSSWVAENDLVPKIENASLYNLTWLLPAEEYFHNNVLEITDGLWSPWDLGNLSWKLALCLLISWLLVYLCLVKGVKSTGKVVYFTATFPYIVLVILLIRGATLPGAIDGITYYIVPKFDKLADPKVWNAAATQVFYSLGTTFGGLVTMSSYNKFHNNCWRDALIVAVLDSVTSLFAGFAIFSIIGYMAGELNVPVPEVTKSGPGLAFIAYPEALARMPGGPFFSIIFFFMLLTLGLDSQFAMIETITTTIEDQFPRARKIKPLFVGLLCAAIFLCGLPLCTQNGMYVFQLIDGYSAGYCLIMLAMFEVACVIYVYGLNSFLKDVESMIGFKPGWYWRICWAAITPLFLLFILIFSFIGVGAPKYNNYVFEPWLQGVGWTISLMSILCVPAFAAYQTIKVLLSGKPLRSLLKVSPKWGEASLACATEGLDCVTPTSPNAPREAFITLGMNPPPTSPTIPTAVPLLVRNDKGDFV